MRPLADVRVLDLSRLLPGPFATLVLADLGASVDKIEDPQGGDYLRVMPPQIAGESAAFQLLNRGKRSAVLDLKKPEGKAAFLRLVGSYDILFEQFRPGVLDRLGLGHAALRAAHPRLIICALTGFYPQSVSPDMSPEEMELNIIRLLAKMPTIAAWTYKNNMGHPLNYPRNDMDYCANFLYMMFSFPTEKYEINPVVVRALNKLLILHADHEQNCSTSTVRLVGSANASLYGSVSAGINALWGPLHGGANQEVIEMLEAIEKDGGDTSKFINKAKDKNDPFRLMGFGHRVYKNFDPRAKIIKVAADEVLQALGMQDSPLLKIAQELEQAALTDQYFIERKLYPNVDFYSGIIYKALGIPTEMFTVMFALGRLPGWIAQWKEMRENKEPIGRPRQIYTGELERDYQGIEAR